LRGRFALFFASCFLLALSLILKVSGRETHRGSGAETTGGAIVLGAWLEQTWERRAHLGYCSRPDRTMMGKAVSTQQRQKEDKNEQEQKHKDVHEAFSLLEMRRRNRFLLKKENKDRREGKSSR
jgi:hypothetical protein